MANRSVAGKSREVDPLFPIPAGMEDDWNYGEDAVVESADGGADIEETNFEDIEEVGSDMDLFDEGEGEGSYDTPEVPENLRVVTQVLRRLPDGSNVVDLVVEVDDVPNIVKFDVRVTKS